MNRHKGFLIILFIILLIIPGVAMLLFTGCQKEPKTVTIGIVNMAQTLDDVVQSFKTAMTELGYIENKNIIYLYDGPLKIKSAIDPAIEKIKEKKPDLVISLSTPVTLKVQKAFAAEGTPIVFAPVSDPVGSGFVKSLKEPGGNLTGIQLGAAGIKGLEWLSRIVPGLKRIYVPFNPDDKSMVLMLRVLKKAAAARGIELFMAEGRSPKAILAVLNKIPEDVQAVWQLGSPFWPMYMEPFIQKTLEAKKPLKSHKYEWVEKGALMAFGLDGNAMGKQASRQVHKILQGTPPAVIAVEQTEFLLSVNLKTAATLGLTIPESILKQADRVYR